MSDHPVEESLDPRLGDQSSWVRSEDEAKMGSCQEDTSLLFDPLLNVKVEFDERKECQDDTSLMFDPLLNVKVEFNEQKDERVLYFCEDCGKSFKSKRGYKNHSPDKFRERIKCTECGADFAGPSSLYLHVKNIHGQVKYPCDQCEYKATSKQGLERHVQSLHLNAKFYCEQCDAVLSSRGYLLKHIKAVHEKKKYICDQCPDKVYTFYCSLKKHKDAVHAGIYHMCDICGHKSTTKSHLKTHKKKHRDITTTSLTDSSSVNSG